MQSNKTTNERTNRIKYRSDTQKGRDGRKIVHCSLKTHFRDRMHKKRVDIEEEGNLCAHEITNAGTYLYRHTRTHTHTGTNEGRNE